MHLTSIDTYIYSNIYILIRYFLILSEFEKGTVEFLTL